MTKPNQYRAGQYLQAELKTFSDDTPEEKTIEILLRCSELADQDLAECLTSEHKQKVWAALMSAVEIVIRSYGGDGIASNALREALTNTSLGRPGEHDLTSPAVPNTQTMDSEWIRACMIALIDEFPSDRQQTYKDAALALEVSEDSLKKMRENFRGGRIGADVLKYLVETAKKMIKEFGYNNLSEILTPKPPPRA